MKTIEVTRRQVLRGAGGFTLVLPLLPSLYPRGVRAQLATRPCFAAMMTAHGAVHPSDMYPTSAQPNTMNLYSGHTIKWGPLQVDGSGRISNVLRAPNLTPALTAKLNVLRGFDYPFYIGHHSGGHLGNFVRSDQGPKNLEAFATIDQIMAWSPSFYRDANSFRQRSMVFGSNGFPGAVSFGYANPAAKTGAVNAISPEGNLVNLFQRLFGGSSGGGSQSPTAPARTPIIDRVMQSYRSLRQSNRRLSADDRERLEAHVTFLTDLQRRLMASGGSGGGATPAQCTNVMQPTLTNAMNGYPAYNSIIALAFACGVSRVATINLPSGTFTSVPHGPWHQDVAHNHRTAANQRALAEAAQKSFEYVFVDLMRKLDALEIAPGTTALDATLIQWTHESGYITHDAQDMPIVTAGKAGGFFKTGLWVDYRSGKKMRLFGSLQEQSLGLLHRQWLATALQAMGVPPSEFEKNGRPGYGDPYMDSGYTSNVPAQTHQNASQPVPVITG